MCYPVSMKARPARPRLARRESAGGPGRAPGNWNTVLLVQIRLAGTPDTTPP